MIHVLGVRRVLHAVRDRQAADDLYVRMFGAVRLQSGFIEAEGREASVLAIHSVQVETLPAQSDADVAGYVEHTGEGLCGLVLAVSDLEGAERHLRGEGLNIQRRAPSLLVVSREDVFGLRYELMDAAYLDRWPSPANEDLPGPGFAVQSPFSLFVPDSEEAAQRYERAFGARRLYVGQGTFTADKFILMQLGANTVSLIEPRTEKEAVAKMTDRQGRSGIHGVFYEVHDLEQAAQHLISRGIGVIGDRKNWVMPHPRMCFGARFMLTKRGGLIS